MGHKLHTYVAIIIMSYVLEVSTYKDVLWFYFSVHYSVSMEVYQSKP